ncbi:hypothetical protein PsorP6_001873 [Peronosclerospora sorghi]|uniref:Uncharacterized protein n=1 Tax=Peronosclerospora sorghi TaxID=230839 RepID=A0ACC0WU94_9STRA|nr:hypothetical protein PsorP6_001873 [Peronosclerospora sorghi]
MPPLQPLAPVPVAPTRVFRASEPLAFLEKIDRIEIHTTIVRKGVTYYVLDLYLKHSTSRIPTNKGVHGTTRRGQPDYQLERRYNDFANLRYQVWSYAQRKHPDRGGCKYCDAFVTYIVRSMSQPRLLVKLGTNVDTRKKLMTTFCNEFVRMTMGGKTESRPSHAACDGMHAIPAHTTMQVHETVLLPPVSPMDVAKKCLVRDLGGTLPSTVDDQFVTSFKRTSDFINMVDDT